MRRIIGIGVTSLALLLPAAAWGQEGYERQPGDRPAQDREAGDRPMGDRTVAGTQKIEEGVLKLSNEDVRKVKQALSDRGYQVSMEDDTKIEAEALTQFQESVGIEGSGELDIATLNALGFGAVVALSPDVEGAETARGQVQGIGELPAGFDYEGSILGVGKNVLGFLVVDEDAVTKIQERLKEEGYYQGEASGKFDESFVSALKQFQQAKGIQATGLLDLQTLAWFPDAGIECELTGKSESEIEQPKGIEKIGTEVPAGLGTPEEKEEEHMKPKPPGEDPHGTMPSPDERR